MIRLNVHRAASIGATLLITSFIISTVTVEFLGFEAYLVEVKTWIFRVLPLLIILMATAGATGRKLASQSAGQPASKKAKLMRLVALNGILVLAPCAYFLQKWANLGELGQAFYWVQAIELGFGAINLSLMGMMIKEGITITKLGERIPTPSPG